MKSNEERERVHHNARIDCRKFENGEPYLELYFPTNQGEVRIPITTGFAQIIGQAGAATRERFEKLRGLN